MASPAVRHKLNRSSDTSRLPSPAVWGDFPWLAIQAGELNGVLFADDFADFPLVGTQTTQINHGRYKLYAASGCSIAPVSAVNSVELGGGALAINTDTDNDEASIAQSYPGFLLTGLNSNSGKLCFECCYAQKSVATNMASTFIGLAETELFTLGSNVPHNSGDAIDASGALIGFRIEEDGLGVVDTVYSDRATSFTNVGDTEGGTLVAYTFKKLGFVYDPEKSSNCITFFADNVELSTKLSRSTLTGLTNLDANALGLLWSVAADSAGTSFSGYLKWWRCGQLLP